jgi:hypothetical protein
MDRIDRFRRLARSSPWRWRTVRFTFDDGDLEPVRAWVRRPDSLRVESLDGRLLEARAGDQRPAGFVTFLVGPPGSTADLEPVVPPEPIWWTDPGARRPATDADGLVVDPASLPPEVVVDDAMWQNYRWVAMLNPRELADGERGDVPVEVDSVTAAIRHGRPTLFATVRVIDGYAPRCSCCPLLPSRQAVIAEGYGDPESPFADAHRVAVDLATSICVSARELGGPRDGEGFDVVLEAVDEPMGDDLFLMTDELRLRRQFGADGLRRRGEAAAPGLAPDR